MAFLEVAEAPYKSRF